MPLFVIVAGGMVVLHLVAAAQRPRAAVIVSAILWAFYAYYEFLVATRVLCDTDCNIRVDLVFLLPILGLATYCAYQAYEGRPGQLKVIGTVLGAIGLFAVALIAEDRGYGALMGVVVLVALVIGFLVIRSRSKANRA